MPARKKVSTSLQKSSERSRPRFPSKNYSAKVSKATRPTWWRKEARTLRGWRPSLLGWMPSLLGWRPSQVGWSSCWSRFARALRSWPPSDYEAPSPTQGHSPIFPLQYLLAKAKTTQVVSWCYLHSTSSPSSPAECPPVVARLATSHWSPPSCSSDEERKLCAVDGLDLPGTGSGTDSEPTAHLKNKGDTSAFLHF